MAAARLAQLQYNTSAKFRLESREDSAETAKMQLGDDPCTSFIKAAPDKIPPIAFEYI